MAIPLSTPKEGRASYFDSARKIPFCTLSGNYIASEESKVFSLIESGLHSDTAQHFLLLAPPGTGKTTFSLSSFVQWLHARPELGAFLLFLCPSKDIVKQLANSKEGESDLVAVAHKKGFDVTAKPKARAIVSTPDRAQGLTAHIANHCATLGIKNLIIAFDESHTIASDSDYRKSIGEVYANTLGFSAKLTIDVTATPYDFGQYTGGLAFTAKRGFAYDIHTLPPMPAGADYKQWLAGEGVKMAVAAIEAGYKAIHVRVQNSKVVQMICANLEGRELGARVLPIFADKTKKATKAKAELLAGQYDSEAGALIVVSTSVFDMGVSLNKEVGGGNSLAICLFAQSDSKRKMPHTIVQLANRFRRAGANHVVICVQSKDFAGGAVATLPELYKQAIASFEATNQSDKQLCEAIQASNAKAGEIAHIEKATGAKFSTGGIAPKLATNATKTAINGSVYRAGAMNKALIQWCKGLSMEEYEAYLQLPAFGGVRASLLRSGINIEVGQFIDIESEMLAHLKQCLKDWQAKGAKFFANDYVYNFAGDPKRAGEIMKLYPEAATYKPMNEAENEERAKSKLDSESFAFEALVTIMQQGYEEKPALARLTQIAESAESYGGAVASIKEVISIIEAGNRNAYIAETGQFEYITSLMAKKGEIVRAMIIQATAITAIQESIGKARTAHITALNAEIESDKARVSEAQTKQQRYKAKKALEASEAALSMYQGAGAVYVSRGAIMNEALTIAFEDLRAMIALSSLDTESIKHSIAQTFAVCFLQTEGNGQKQMEAGKRVRQVLASVEAMQGVQLHTIAGFSESEAKEAVSRYLASKAEKLERIEAEKAEKAGAMGAKRTVYITPQNPEPLPAPLPTSLQVPVPNQSGGEFSDIGNAPF